MWFGFSNRLRRLRARRRLAFGVIVQNGVRRRVCFRVRFRLSQALFFGDLFEFGKPLFFGKPLLFGNTLRFRDSRRLRLPLFLGEALFLRPPLRFGDTLGFRLAAPFFALLAHSDNQRGRLGKLFFAEAIKTIVYLLNHDGHIRQRSAAGVGGYARLFVEPGAVFDAHQFREHGAGEIVDLRWRNAHRCEVRRHGFHKADTRLHINRFFDGAYHVNGDVRCTCLQRHVAGACVQRDEEPPCDCAHLQKGTGGDLVQVVRGQRAATQTIEHQRSNTQVLIGVG